MDKEVSPNIDGGDVFERNTLNTVFLFPPFRSTAPSSISSPSVTSYSFSISDNPKSCTDSTELSVINKGFVEASELLEGMEITTDDSGNGNTRNESNGGATETEEHLHFLLSTEARFIANKLAASEIFEDSFTGNLDSIEASWLHDSELSRALEIYTELEVLSQIESEMVAKSVEAAAEAAAEESHPPILQDSVTETNISLEETEKPENLPDSSLKLTRSASCDDIISPKKSRDAKEIVCKLQEILYNPSESNDKKVSQGQKLVRSLSDLLLVSDKDENSKAPSKGSVQNQRSKSFTGLKKSYVAPEKAVNTSMATKVPNIKLHHTDFVGRLKIKKNDHEPRRGPLKAIPLENMRNVKRTPENGGEMVKAHTPDNAPALKPCASSTPVTTGAVRNTHRSPTPMRKSYSDGPMELQKIRLSPSNQAQRKKEGPATLTLPKRGGSLSGKGMMSSLSKIRENMKKLPEYKDFNARSLNKSTDAMSRPLKARSMSGDVMILKSNKENQGK